MTEIQRRSFLVGGTTILGAALFSLQACAPATGGDPNLGSGFSAWLRIAEDDSIVVYSPHIDFGQGSHTALAQMLAEELDADWAKVRTEQAPAEKAFANAALVRFFALSGAPHFLAGAANGLSNLIATNMTLQITGGSSAISGTGQFGMRKLGAAVRLAMVEVAAKRLGVPADQLTTENSQVKHARSSRTLRYGELAIEAAERSLAADPPLKARSAYKIIGQSPARPDIVGKVDGSAKYGIDFGLPDMRVATIMAAPVRGGTLTSVETAPAMAIKGVESVIKLDAAVVVVAKGYWAAQKGLQALRPVFSDGGSGAISSAAMFEAQTKLVSEGKGGKAKKTGDVAGALASAAKSVDAIYKVPFLQQAQMEPLALVAHHHDGKLDVWGGTQDPLTTKKIIAKESGLKADDVTFHPMIMGGGFGRRFPDHMQIIGQISKLAMQVPYPVKLIWSREEDVRQGAYRPQVLARMRGGLDPDGKINAWSNDYAQPAASPDEAGVPYVIPNHQLVHHEYKSNQPEAFWRSVNNSQHGFFNECLMDELAQAAGVDPLAFRRTHLPGDGRHAKVLDAVGKASGWGGALPAGHGRGIALVESFGTIVAEVVEASVDASGKPKVHKVFAAVDCGTTINPRNAQAQIMGGIIMGLSAALGESITLDKGAVVQSNFNDYPILRMADAPSIEIAFIESDGPVGGLGEPGLPPVAPALAGALFAATGKRYRQLPIIAQA
jgi:isoquinoline 1-oxidoreductase subunit beta